MLGEITHLQAIVDDLTGLTEDPHKLPPASEQVSRDAAGLPRTHPHQKRIPSDACAREGLSAVVSVFDSSSESFCA